MCGTARWLVPLVIAASSITGAHASLPPPFEALGAWIEARVAALEPIATTRPERRELAALRRADVVLDRASPATLGAELVLAEKVLRTLPAGAADDPELRPVLETLAAALLGEARAWEETVSYLDDGRLTTLRKLARVRSSMTRAETATELSSCLHALRQAVFRANALARVLGRMRMQRSRWRIAVVDQGPYLKAPVLVTNGREEVVLYTRVTVAGPEVRSATIRNARLVAGATEIVGVSLVDAAAGRGGALHLVVFTPPTAPGEERGPLEYARRDADGSWSRETLTSEGRLGEAAIAVSDAGQVWIALVSTAGDALQALSRSPGTSWQVETVPLLSPRAVQVQPGAIALGDDVGAVWIVYAVGSPPGRIVSLATRLPDGGWTESDACRDFRPNPRGSGTVRRGPDGTLHVCSEVNHGDEVRYWRRPPDGRWQQSDVPRTALAPAWTSTLAVSGAGDVHVVFGIGVACLQARLPAGKSDWTVGPLLDAGASFGGASCVADERGRVHIALLESGAVLYGRR